MAVSVSGPVGIRFRTQPVTNNQADQIKIVDLLSVISVNQGGKREAWEMAGRPHAGPGGSCPKGIADAIWDFQTHWKHRGVFRNIDGVVDPGGNTLKQLNKLADEAPGRARILVGSDQIILAYPQMADVVNPSAGSMLVELTNYDIGSDELKREHKDAIFSANLKGFGKDFTFVNAYDFHSNTGGPGFDNRGLAERRAEKATSFARFTGLVDARVRHWGYMPIRWQKGMPEGESPEMRKVLLLFRADSTFDGRPRAVTAGMTLKHL